jgi:hypothetical protein
MTGTTGCERVRKVAGAQLPGRAAHRLTWPCARNSAMSALQVGQGLTTLRTRIVRRPAAPRSSASSRPCPEPGHIQCRACYMLLCLTHGLLQTIYSAWKHVGQALPHAWTHVHVPHAFQVPGAQAERRRQLWVSACAPRTCWPGRACRSGGRRAWTAAPSARPCTACRRTRAARARARSPASRARSEGGSGRAHAHVVAAGPEDVQLTAHMDTYTCGHGVCFLAASTLP